MVRAAFLAFTDFPINDGGLFYAFMLVCAEDWPHLPASVFYNGQEIPFAYPPLSFLLAAGFARLGIAPLAIVHAAPILMNAAYMILSVALLRVARVPLAVTVLAAGLLAFVPRSYEWLVMGGGLSRSLGSITYILSLILVQIAIGRRKASRPLILVGAGLTVGLTALSHLEWGVLAAASVLILLALSAGSVKRFVSWSLLVGAVAVLVVLPWLVQVWHIHGPQPFLAAAATSQVGGSEHLDNAIDALWVPRDVAPLIPIGIYASWRHGDRVWALLLLAAILLTPRHAGTPAALFKAVLAGYAILALLDWLRTALDSLQGAWARRLRAQATPVRLFSAATISLIAMALLGSAKLVIRGQTFAVLSPAQRDAMAWIARRAPDGRFVIRNPDSWPEDQVSEWFPVISGAVSLSTVQGTEWMAGGEFRRRVEAEKAFKVDAACSTIIDRLALFGDPTHVWVDLRPRPRDLIPPRPDCFESSPAFSEVFRNAEVALFRRTPP